MNCTLPCVLLLNPQSITASVTIYTVSKRDNCVNSISISNGCINNTFWKGFLVYNIALTCSHAHMHLQLHRYGPHFTVSIFEQPLCV